MTELLKRCLSGIAGAAVLAPTVYFSFIVAENVYLEYFLSHEKADKPYIPPTPWQDRAFLVAFWTVAILALLASYRLLRFAWKSRNNDSSGSGVMLSP